MPPTTAELRRWGKKHVLKTSIVSFQRIWVESNEHNKGWDRSVLRVGCCCCCCCCCCQISCTLPMYVSHLLHVYTSYLLWLKVKRLHQGRELTSVDTSVLGWVLLGLHLFVGTLELPNFRMVAELWHALGHFRDSKRDGRTCRGFW